MPEGPREPDEPVEDLQEEIKRLRRRLDRERAARRAAERTGEQATTALYDALQDLRAAQADLLEQADRDRVVGELVRRFRQDLDPVRLRERACEGLQGVLGTDRCELVTDLWVERPLLADLLDSGADPAGGVWLDDLAGRDDLAHEVGGAAVGCEPVGVGADHVEWVVVVSAEHRGWSARDRALVRGISRDLGASLVQADAWAQQETTMRRLRELDQAKSDFVATVSHELRTPLSSIRGYSELLRERMLGDLTPQQAKAVAVLDRNTERLLRLVSDLLTLAEVDAGESRHTVVEPVDLGTVVEDAHRSLMPLLGARDLEVELPVAGAVDATVLGASGQLDRVVLNLLSNAVKFTPDRGRVAVSLDVEERSGTANVVLRVSDTGIGIAADQQHQLFGRFFRTDDAQQRAIQGTGLGLAVCKAIVDTHGGEITVDSEVGVGTTVTVALPQLVPALPHGGTGPAARNG